MNEDCSGFDEEASQLEQLQDMLMNIQSESVIEISSFIQNFFMNTPEKRRQLACQILLPIKYHSESFSHIIKLVLQLRDSLFELPIYLLNAISQEISSETIIPYQNSIQAFLYECYKANIFEITDIITLLKTCHEHFSLFNESICSLFCWFAPEIEKEDQLFFTECLEAFRFHLQYTEFQSVYQSILNNFDKLRENDWQLFKQQRDSTKSINPIYQAIRKDDVDQLKDLIFNYHSNSNDHSNLNDIEFDIDRQYEISPFEPSWIMRFKPTCIQIAAFFGSIRCFKFFILNKANPHKKAGCNGCFGGLNGDYGMPLTYFAIAGGNAEIIHLTEQLGCNFYSDVLFSSVVFHRYEVFEWLVGTKQCDYKVRDANGDSVLHLAVLSDNIKVLKYLRENNELHNEVDEFQLSLVHYAAKYGTFAVLDFMINSESHNSSNNNEDDDDEIVLNDEFVSFDVNAKDDEKMTPLHYAVKYRRYEAVVVLLGHPKVDPNVKNRNGWTPLHFGVSSQNVEMVKLLLDHNKIDQNVKNNSLVSPLSMATQMHLEEIKKLFSLASSNLIMNKIRPQTTQGVLRKRPLTGFSGGYSRKNNNGSYNSCIHQNDSICGDNNNRRNICSVSSLRSDKKCRPSTTMKSTRQGGRISSSKTLPNDINENIREPKETIVRFELQKRNEKPKLHYPFQHANSRLQTSQLGKEKRISRTASGLRKQASNFSTVSNLSRTKWKTPNIVD